MTHASTPFRSLTALGASLVLLAQSLAFAEAPGRRILAGDDSTRRLAIIAPDGSVEWEIPVTAIHDAAVLPNGNVLLQQGWTRVQEVTPTRQVVWEYDAAKANPGKPVEVHAFQRLPSGLTMVAESGPARIIEVDAAGKVHREVKLKVDRPNAHADTRLVRKLDNGNYLVAHEADGRVREYDATGAIVWQFDIPLFGKERKGGHGPEAFGNSVFSATRLANGNTLIGTGNGHSILEVDRAGKIVWKIEQNDLPGITLAWVTRVERLPNGNTLIGNCHAGPENPQMIEVTPDRKVVWSWKDFTHFGNSTPVVALLPAKPTP
jgi:PQQ-like domain